MTSHACLINSIKQSVFIFGGHLHWDIFAVVVSRCFPRVSTGSIRLATTASRPQPQYMAKVKSKEMPLVTWKPNVTCMNKNSTGVLQI